MFNAIRQHAVSWPLAISEEPSDGEQKPQWGGLQISSDRDDGRIFWGLKNSISGFFFSAGKFWKVFFGVA